MSGIACEEDGRWRLEQILSGGRKATDYRQASAADPRLAAAVEDMIAGVPFDAEAERAARDADWRQWSRGNLSDAGFSPGEQPPFAPVLPSWLDPLFPWAPPSFPIGDASGREKG